MTKERLKAYKPLCREIEQLEQMIAECEAEMQSPKIQRLTGMPSAASPSGDALERLVVRHQMLIDRYIERKSILLTERMNIESEIEAVFNADDRTLLRLRYIQGYEWEEICCLMHLSWRQIHRRHGRALNAIRKDGET